jgi:hypothetical protein
MTFERGVFERGVWSAGMCALMAVILLIFGIGRWLGASLLKSSGLRRVKVWSFFGKASFGIGLALVRGFWAEICCLGVWTQRGMIFLRIYQAGPRVELARPLERCSRFCPGNFWIGLRAGILDLAEIEIHGSAVAFVG